ncbi:hypothetical protein Dimus_022473 [Dionaea muscipula]
MERWLRERCSLFSLGFLGFPHLFCVGFLLVLTGHRGPLLPVFSGGRRHGAGLHFFSSGELAPPIWARRGDAFLEGWEEWVKVLPVRFARRKVSDLQRPRTLLKKMNRAAKEEDKLRPHLDCRRSRRLSPTLLSAASDLGSVRKGRLSPIDEAEMSGGMWSAVEACPEMLPASSSAIGTPDNLAQNCPVSDSMPMTMVQVEASESLVPVLMKEVSTTSSPTDSLAAAKKIAADFVADGDSAEVPPGGVVDAGAGVPALPSRSGANALVAGDDVLSDSCFTVSNLASSGGASENCAAVGMVREDEEGCGHLGSVAVDCRDPPASSSLYLSAPL